MSNMEEFDRTFTAFPEHPFNEESEDSNFVSSIFNKVKSITTAASNAVHNVLPIPNPDPFITSENADAVIASSPMARPSRILSHHGPITFPVKSHPQAVGALKEMRYGSGSHSRNPSGSSVKSKHRSSGSGDLSHNSPTSHRKNLSTGSAGGTTGLNSNLNNRGANSNSGLSTSPSINNTPTNAIAITPSNARISSGDISTSMVTPSVIEAATLSTPSRDPVSSLNQNLQIPYQPQIYPNTPRSIKVKQYEHPSNITSGTSNGSRISNTADENTNNRFDTNSKIKLNSTSTTLNSKSTNGIKTNKITNSPVNESQQQQQNMTPSANLSTHLFSPLAPTHSSPVTKLTSDARVSNGIVTGDFNFPRNPSNPFTDSTVQVPPNDLSRSLKSQLSYSSNGSRTMGNTNNITKKNNFNNPQPSSNMLQYPGQSVINATIGTISQGVGTLQSRFSLSGSSYLGSNNNSNNNTKNNSNTNSNNGTATNDSSIYSGRDTTSSLDRENSSDAESIYSTAAKRYFNSRVDRRPAPLKNGGLGKEFWMKDEHATECFGCTAKFTSKLTPFFFITIIYISFLINLFLTSYINHCHCYYSISAETSLQNLWPNFLFKMHKTY